MGVVAGLLQAWGGGGTVAMLSAVAVALICRPKDKGGVKKQRLFHFCETTSQRVEKVQLQISIRCQTSRK